MTQALQIRLLGRPRFSWQGRPWDVVAPPKTLPLLAYLVFNRGALLRRETVAFALWPDDSESDARANLRRHLHRLGQALPSDGASQWFTTTGATIAWHHAAAWVDVAAFEDAIAAGRLRDAVALYDGDVLEGYDEPWLAPERERLHAAYCSALAAIVRDARASGAFADAIAYAERLLAAEPWREDALRWLVAARYEGGDRAGALADYEAFAVRLRDEFAAEPSSETRALQRLIASDAVLCVPGDEVAENRALQLPFVGRARALQRMLRRWDAARAGSGGAVFVSGEAGVGKSRLSAEIATRVEAQGGRVLSGVTGHLETVPYQAMVEALRRALPSLLDRDVDALWLGVLSLVLPDILVRRPAVRAPARIGSIAERRRLFDAFGAALTSLARVRPVLLLLEDMHWAGPDSIDALDAIARLAPAEPLLVVVTYRDDALREDARRALHRLESDEIAQSELLGPLAHGDVLALAEHLFGAEAGIAERAGRLFSVSGGNPLFLSEAIRTQHEAGAAGAVPPTLEQTIAARIARLPNDARVLAGAASVFGDGFEIEALASVCGWRESEVVENLDVLLEYGIVRAGTKRVRASYAFTHDLIHAAMYAQTPEPARRLAHRRAARALQRIYAGREDELAAEFAVHFERAEMYEEAATAYLRAAHRASAMFANDDVVRLASAGAALTNDARICFELLILREDVHARRGDNAAAAADIAELTRLANALGDDNARCDTLVRAIALYHASGDIGSAADSIAELERIAQRTGEPARVAVAKSCAATHVQLQGRTKEAIAALREALRAYEAVGDERRVASLQGQVAEMLAQSGDAHGADAATVAAREVAERSGDRALLVDVLGAASRTCHHLRRYESLQAVALELLAVASETGDANAEGQAHTSYGNACVALFDFARADEHYEHALAIYRRSGNKLGSAVIASNRGAMYGRVGDWPRSRAASSEAREAFAELGDLARELAATFNEAQACVETGDPQRGLTLALRAKDLAAAHGGAPLDAAALGLIGVCERHLGRFSAAVAHLEACVERERALPNATEIESALAELALAYVDNGDVSAALRVAREIDALGAETGLTHPQLLAWAAYRAYDAAGEEEKAAAALRAARRLTKTLLARIPPQWQDAYRDWRLNRSIAAASPPASRARPAR